VLNNIIKGDQMGYAKLFSEILASTIWQESNHIKIVWITMLAMKDERHEVMASVPGLAKMAGVSREQCEEGLNVLSSPDVDSRSQEYQGRRILKCDGGWKILNGEKFRKKMSLEAKKEYQKEWIANKRNNINSVTFVDDVDTTEHNRTEQNRTEQNISDQNRTKQNKTKKVNTLTSNDEVAGVFLKYCLSWSKNPKTYQLTPIRRQWVKEAISIYGLDGVKIAIHNFRVDPFEKRAQFNDIKYLFGKRERIDKWCQPRTIQNTSAFQKTITKQQDTEDTMNIALQMLGEKND